MPVPDWSQLSDHERRSVLRDQLLGRHEFPIEPAVLVTRAESMLAALSQRPPERLIEYLLALESSMRSQGIEISTRRVTMLQRNILAVHAARLTLAEAGGLPVHDLSWNDSAFLGVAYGLPGAPGARSTRPRFSRCIARPGKFPVWPRMTPGNACWASPTHPPRRAGLQRGFPLGDEDLGLVLLEAVSAVEPEEKRLALCLILYLGLRNRRALPHTVVETITRPVVPLLTQGNKTHSVYGQPLQRCREVAALCSGFHAAPGSPGAAREHHLRALLQGLLPDGFEHTTPGDLHDFFNGLWEQFGVESCYAPPQ